MYNVHIGLLNISSIILGDQLPQSQENEFGEYKYHSHGKFA